MSSTNTLSTPCQSPIRRIFSHLAICHSLILFRKPSRLPETLSLPSLRCRNPPYRRRRRSYHHSTMTASAPSDVSDGPVLRLINKRIRSLRKKYNRILQTEKSVALGKSLNKEQEEVLRSKPSVSASIDELEKLRQPLANAVAEEISLAVQHHQVSESGTPSFTTAESDAEENGVNEHNVGEIENILNLLYFATMFDVKNQSDFTKTMLTRAHERGCCLTYDYVTDDEDATDDLLLERDLDLIAKLGGLLTARPAESFLSHKNALQRCLEHVKLWLSNSDQPIDSDQNVTYAGLRAKLNKIMASDFFTITPKVTVEMAVAAVGNYASFPDLVPSSMEQVGMVVENGHSEELSEEKDKNSPNSQGTENHEEEVKFGSFHIPEVAQIKPDKSDEGQNLSNSESKEQHRAPRRNYQNQRGGRGRGYFNGRESRGGRRGGTSYHNGGNQYYVKVGDYNPRSSHDNSSRGRGGGGGGRNLQKHHSLGGVQSGGQYTN